MQHFFWFSLKNLTVSDIKKKEKHFIYMYIMSLVNKC